MTVIRLTRMGRNKKPFYRIVVTDSRKRRDSGWIESIGYYNPVSNPKELKIRISYLKLSDEIHSEVQEKLIKLKQENEILRTKCIELENELQAIYRSKSWRITKPLREIKKILSRPKGCK
jgi:small subunit ribosomal protein S16